jgi:hypothetical protein
VQVLAWELQMMIENVGRTRCQVVAHRKYVYKALEEESGALETKLRQANQVVRTNRLLKVIQMSMMRAECLS